MRSPVPDLGERLLIGLDGLDAGAADGAGFLLGLHARLCGVARLLRGLDAGMEIDALRFLRSSAHA